jgi:hypothetical protein
MLRVLLLLKAGAELLLVLRSLLAELLPGLQFLLFLFLAAVAAGGAAFASTGGSNAACVAHANTGCGYCWQSCCCCC